MLELICSYKIAILRLIITAGVLLFTNPLISQQNYIVFGKVSVTQGSVIGVDAILESENSKSPITLNDKGEFKSNLNWNTTYLFIFSKKGFIAKSIRFSTQIPNSVNLNTIEPYLLLVELWPVMANVDTAFFENPVGYIKFDPAINDFDFDRDYSLKVKYTTPVQKKKNENTIDNQINNRIRIDANQKKQATNNEEFKSESNEIIKIIKLNSKPKSLYAPDFPPLLDDYPLGITLEEFGVTGRNVTRVVLNDNGYLKVLLKVNHDWGGVYFFINEAPDYYRGITSETYIKLSHNEGRK